MKKQKKNKGERFKKFWNVYKKLDEKEKEKNEIKKALKANRPKGYLAKKIGVYSFWTIMAMIVLLLVVVNVNKGNVSADNDEQDLKQYSQAISDFGRQFLKSYLPIQFNENTQVNALQTERQEKLAPYVTSDILATLSKVQQDTHNIALKDIYVHDVQANGDTYLITYKINMLLSTNPFSKTILKDDKTDKSKVEIVKNNKTVYMTVKVFHQEDEDRFVVYELPSFEAVEGNEQSINVNEKAGLTTLLDMTKEKQIASFVQTFLDSYMKDTKDKLSYLVVPEYELNGFNEALKLMSLEQVEVFEGAANNEYLVYANALIADSDTEVVYPTTYTLAVVENDGVYLVKAVDDKSYIQKALDYKLEVEMAEKQ